MSGQKAPGDNAGPRPAAAPPASASAEQVPIGLLVDLSTNQTLFARDARRRFIPASITKVMSAYVAFGKIESGAMDLRQRIVVSEEIAEEWGGTGSTMFLEKGDVVTVEELLRGITSVSANDASIALAVHGAGSVEQWVAEMNEAAQALGMRDSHFGTPNGWPDEGRTFTTARDLAALAKALITDHPALYRHFFGREGFSYDGVAQANRDPLVGRVDGADGIKTGYTNEAGFGFLGSAVRNGRRLLVVAAATPTGPARDDASRDLIEWGFQAFATRRLFGKDQRIGAAMVQGGEEDEVQLLAARPIHASIPQGAQDSAITLSVRYLGPIPAPITRGEEIAELEVQIEGHGTHRVPLVAAADVAEADFWTRLRNGIAGILS